MAIEFPNHTVQLTKAELRIRDFIETNTTEFLFMSMQQLAQAIGVSEATISRFARHVGCADFKQVKEMVHSQYVNQGPAGKMAATLMATESFKLDHYLEKLIGQLEKTRSLIDPEAFDGAIALLSTSRHIYIHAKSASQSMGRLLHFRLRRMGFLVTLLPSGGSEIVEGLANVTKDDLVILFRFSQLSEESQFILEYQKEIGFKTIAFTGRLSVSIEEQTDVTLYVYRGLEQEYHSQVAPVAVIDSLVVALTEKMGAVSARKLTHMQSMKDQYKKSGK